MSLTTKKSKTNEKIAFSPSKNIYLDENENAGENIITDDGIMPFFDMSKKQGIRALFSGGTGSGKSYMARKAIEQIKPKKIYIFSSIDDGDYDNIKGSTVIKVDLNTLIENTGYDVHTIYEQMENNCLSIFDDVMSFGSKLSKPYLDLRRIILQKSRHKNQSCFVCEQTAMDGAKSREVLLNCQYFYCYPKNNFRSFNNLAKIYLGMSPEQIEKCRNLGRFVMINKNYPSYYVSNKEVGVL